MAKKFLLVALILLLALLSPALADDVVPDSISITAGNHVLAANGEDITPITVTVTNQSSAIEGLNVTFSVNDSRLGTLSPVSATTSGTGEAQTTFRVNITPGMANITARVSYMNEGLHQYQENTTLIEIQNLIPDSFNLTTTKDWLVANGTDNCMAILEVKNGTHPVPFLNVHFDALEKDMGSFSPETTQTLDSGIAESRFTAAHKSGNATLRALVTYQAGGNETVVGVSVTQKIDHDQPFILSSYNVPGQITVGNSAPIILRYIDYWGNPIDSKRFAENVTFMVSAPAGDALFVNVTLPSNVTTIPVDIHGEVTAWLRASNQPAINTVRINPDMGSLPDHYFFIQGLANKTPTSIQQVFDPGGYMGNPPKLYADGFSRYAITYTLRDEFGNGVMLSPIEITTVVNGVSRPEETNIVYTNSLGQAMVTYGPKTSIGHVVLTATSIDNSSVSCSKEVWFISQQADDMQFTAVPDSMASSDVEGWVPAELMAKIIDENGNPVKDEVVNFTMGPASYDGTYNVTANPQLLNNSAVSDDDGYAIAYFKPGAFTTNWLDPRYNETATGRCNITASWSNTTTGKSASHTIQLSWKNYPYLTIETSVFPQTVNVTGFVDVVVRLKGDGWALHPKPIDAVLCTDRSGSMLEDQPDRMVAVMGASKEFNGAMQIGPTKDHVGLVSFGTDSWAKLSPNYHYIGRVNCYSPSGGWRTRTLNVPLYDWTNVYGVSSTSNNLPSPPDSNFGWVYNDNSYDISGFNYNYQNYWPYSVSYDNNSAHQQYINAHYPGNNRNYGDYAVIETHLSITPGLINSSIDVMVPSGGTPMRYGIYRSIQEVIANGRTSAVRAIIVLSDGDYNWYGDPLARSSDSGHTSWDPTDFGNLDNDWYSFSGLNTSDQNMSNYAKHNNIRIYSIGYAQDISSGGRDTLRILAESTGGKYYNGTAANIGDIYKGIAGELRTEAGVGTQMNLQYDALEVNYNITYVNDTYHVFSYVPNTSIDSYLTNQTPYYRPPHTPPYPYEVNQSNEFNTTHKLTFNIGTIYLGQIWESTYRLQVLTDGSINVFGPGSKVLFNGTVGPSNLTIPKTYITGVPEMVTTGINTSVLTITVGSSTETPQGNIAWPIYRNYTGVMLVTEDYYISSDGGMRWVLVDKKVLTPEQANQNSQWSYPRNLLPPGPIILRLVSNANDAPGPVIVAAPPSTTYTIPDKSYIILK